MTIAASDTTVAEPKLVDGVSYTWLSQRMEEERDMVVAELDVWMRQRMATSHLTLLRELQARYLRQVGVGVELECPADETSAKQCFPEKKKRRAAAAPTEAKQSVAAESTLTGESLDSLDREMPKTPESVGASPTTRGRLRHWASFANTSTGSGGDDNESCVQKLLVRIVDSSAFELCSQIMILANSIAMALTMQYDSYTAGYLLHLEGYTEPASSKWPEADVVLGTLDEAFNVIFAIELAMRLAAFRLQAFKSPWICFDCILVVTSMLEMLQLVAIDPTALRCIRLFRVLRSVRLGKLAYAVESLFLLVRSIKASMGALFWSFLLLMLVQLGIGMILNQSTKMYLIDESNPYDRRAALFEYYGSFTRTMITMFEITFSNWTISMRVLMGISEWFGLFYVVYRCVLCFAFLNVIQSVFIAETNRVVACDEQILKIRRKKEREAYFTKLRRMLTELDSDRNGYITRDEFELLGADTEFRDAAGSLDIQISDLEHVFTTIAELHNKIGTDKILIEDFLEGLYIMRAPAVGLDVINVLKVVSRMEQKLNRILGDPRGSEAEPMMVEERLFSLSLDHAFEALDNLADEPSFDDQQERTVGI